MSESKRPEPLKYYGFYEHPEAGPLPLVEHPKYPCRLVAYWNGRAVYETDKKISPVLKTALKWTGGSPKQVLAHSINLMRGYVQIVMDFGIQGGKKYSVPLDAVIADMKRQHDAVLRQVEIDEMRAAKRKREEAEKLEETLRLEREVKAQQGLAKAEPPKPKKKRKPPKKRGPWRKKRIIDEPGRYSPSKPCAPPDAKERERLALACLKRVRARCIERCQDARRKYDGTESHYMCIIPHPKYTYSLQCWPSPKGTFTDGKGLTVEEWAENILFNLVEDGYVPVEREILDQFWHMI